jgi:serine/threonine protein kinase
MTLLVVRACPYNHSVDVYSFGIVLWELCTLQKPFGGYGPTQYVRRVVVGGERPSLENTAMRHHVKLQTLLRHCWSPFPSLRPSFQDIQPLLRAIQHATDNSLWRRVGSLPKALVCNNLAIHPVSAKVACVGRFKIIQPFTRRAKTCAVVHQC